MQPGPSHHRAQTWHRSIRPHMLLISLALSPLSLPSLTLLSYSLPSLTHSPLLLTPLSRSLPSVTHSSLSLAEGLLVHAMAPATTALGRSMSLHQFAIFMLLPEKDAQRDFNYM